MTTDDFDAVPIHDEAPGPNGKKLFRPPAAPTVVRTPPHSIEAEEGLIATVFVDPEWVLEKCEAAGLTSGSFYDPMNGLVYRRLHDMRLRKTPISSAVLAEELKMAGELDSIGGFTRLMQLEKASATTEQTSFFIDRLRELEMRRTLIRLSTRLTEHSFNGSPIDELKEEFAAVAKADPSLLASRSLLESRPISIFTVPPETDNSVLLGNRYLCRGDGLVISSSAGMGKSAFTIQASIVWALNRPFMGIKPNGPLTSLIIQAEDSDGDIAEVWVSCCHKLQLTKAEIELVASRVLIVTDRVNRGPSFLTELRKQVAAFHYDLVWINPIASFMSGDGTTQEAIGDFFRAGLNGINTPAAFGYMVVQHTTKPATGKDRSDRRWHEIMYDMAGSYDLIGWARAIISIRPTETYGEFNLVLAKRGIRAGVTKQIPQGVGYRLEAATTIPIRHCSDKMTLPGISRELNVIFWEPREEDPNAPKNSKSGRPQTHPFADFISIFPTSQDSAIGVNDLYRSALKLRHLGRNALYRLIDDGLQSRQIICNSSGKFPVYFLAKQLLDQASP